MFSELPIEARLKSAGRQGMSRWCAACAAALAALVARAGAVSMRHISTSRVHLEFV